jgi:hypothetical protein
VPSYPRAWQLCAGQRLLRRHRILIVWVQWAGVRVVTDRGLVRAHGNGSKVLVEGVRLELLAIVRELVALILLPPRRRVGRQPEIMRPRETKSHNLRSSPSGVDKRGRGRGGTGATAKQHAARDEVGSGVYALTPAPSQRRKRCACAPSCRHSPPSLKHSSSLPWTSSGPPVSLIFFCEFAP